ncbi:MAG: DMT family transporter [Propioniciclava sp.]|uniref:DMT family transporter n=1 Tax=Propioniciclava sp. TaxID=2038686 RepID=UPI0039E2A4CD
MSESPERLSAASVEVPSVDVPATGQPAGPRNSASGLLIALLSAAMFATAGSFAKPLLEAGWSPAAAVLVRLGMASLVLAVPAAFALRGQWHVLRDRWRPILIYGLFACAGVQVAYFNALTFLPVGVSSLLEYLGVVLVVLWVWATTRRRPGWVTLTGMVVAIAGLVVLLNPGSIGVVDPRGFSWAFMAAAGMAVYFLTSASTSGIPPVAFVSAGLGVGTLTLLVVGLLGFLPLQATTADVTMLGGSWPWWTPLAELAIIAAALAYVTGFVGARRLGATVASFVGLTEVVFAVGWAALLIGELPTWGQIVGGLVLLSGVAAVETGNRRDALAATRTPERADSTNQAVSV